MTTFAILSDLHNEFGPYPHPVPEADVLVLAGDIDVKGRGVAWAAQVAKGRPVVYVPGNHEAYGEKLPRHIEKMRATGAPMGVHVVDNEVLTFGAVRVLAATLWTDFAFLGTPGISMNEAGGLRGMTDYARIRLAPTYRRLLPRDTLCWHTHSVRWLTAALAAPWDGPTLVVTHHAPHQLGCNPTEWQEAMTPAYASHLDPLVANGGAAVWVHGHTHWGHDTQIGGTRLLSNAFGYPDARAPGFRPDLVIDL